MDLTDLASFVRVVDLGTITAAAEVEGVPTSTISRRVARLEDDLGVTLLHRTGRRVAPTDDGILLHDRAQGPLLELDQAERALHEAGEEPTGRLVLTAPHDLGAAGWLTTVLTRYRSRYPRVTVEVRLGNQIVDLAADRVDVALRAHGGEVPGGPGLMVRSFRAGAGQVFACRDWVDRHGAPGTPADLSGHDLVLHSSLSATNELLGPGGATHHLGPPAVVVNDFTVVAELIARGVGVGILPPLIARSAPEHRRLAPILPGWHSRSARLSLVWLQRRHLSPRVRAFLDLATEELERAALLD